MLRDCAMTFVQKQFYALNIAQKTCHRLQQRDKDRFFNPIWTSDVADVTEEVSSCHPWELDSTLLGFYHVSPIPDQFRKKE